MWLGFGLVIGVDITTSRHHDVTMRTTLNLNDDIYAAARALADATGRSLGAVISDLAQRGLTPAIPPPDSDGLPCFSVAADAPIIAGNRAVELLADEGLD